MASIRKEGKYYKLYYRIDRRLHKKSLKTSSRKEAERLLRKFEYEMESRKLQNSEGAVKEARLAKFLTEAGKYSLMHKAPQTHKRELRIFKNFLEFCGDIRLEEINFRKIESYIEYLLIDRGFQKSSVNIELRHLSAAFSLALKYEYLEKNPFKGVSKLKVPKKKPIFLTSLQAQTLLNHVREKNIYPHILIALNTGARSSEVLNLKWNDVDFKHRTLKLFGKGAKERTVPMPKTLADYLVSRLEQSEFLAPHPRTVDGVSKVFRRLANQVDLHKFSFHNLRDTYASWLVQQGVSLKIIQELLGHESIQTTLIYAHLEPDSRFVAAEVIDRQLDGLIGAPR